MSLAKLLDLLTANRLYLVQASRLSDKFEGSIPDNVIESYFDKDPDTWLIRLARARYTCCVTCWCLQESESTALWQIFAGESGVAVQSTVRKLRNLMESHNGHFGCVNYIDYSGTADIEPGTLNPILVKRHEFSHEHEARGWVRSPEAPEKLSDMKKLASCPDHHLIEIDPTELIDRIVVSPFAPSWYIDTIKAVVGAVCSGIIVESSDLSNMPNHLINSRADGQYEFDWSPLIPF